MPQRNHQRFTEPAADSWQRVRGLFVDDWGLKLLALAINAGPFGLWFQAELPNAKSWLRPNRKESLAPTFEVKDVVATPGKIKIQGPVNYLKRDRETYSANFSGRTPGEL